MYTFVIDTLPTQHCFKKELIHVVICYDENENSDCKSYFTKVMKIIQKYPIF